ncbi:MAG: hypothetical protein GC159_23840 [Phycisphaera sp.]|nr:hypothetical protein [Phycisphaera sp.]
MSDLIIAFIVLVVVSALLAWAGWCCGRVRQRWVVTLVMGAAVAACVLFLYFLQDRPILARLIPWSGVVVLGAWGVPLSAFGAGVLMTAGRSRMWLRVVFAVALLGAGAYSSLIRFTGDVPACRDRWIGNVCLQSRDGNCGPAAAATLLAARDIHAAEAEMARLCLTGHSGTTYLGLYRGLKRATADTEWDVEPFTGTPDDLRNIDGPAILWLMLTDEAALNDSRYEQRWGWQFNVPHAVVLLGFSDSGRPIIGDPAVGPEMWGMNALDTLWRDGRALRLVRR